MSQDSRDKQNILIIDVNTELIRKVREALEPDGYSFISANSGEAGIELAKEARPSLIFVNAGISEGMRGLEICKAIHEAEELAGTPLVILTPRNVIITGRDRELYGIVDYVTYIFNAEDLRRKTRDLVSLQIEQGTQPGELPEEDQSKGQDIASSADDQEWGDQEFAVQPESPGLQPTGPDIPEQTDENIPEDAPAASEEKAGSHSDGDDLGSPSLSTEEYEHAYRGKRFRRSAFLISFVILLAVVAAGAIIYYEDFWSIPFFQMSQPDTLSPPSPGEQQEADPVHREEQMLPPAGVEDTATPPETAPTSPVIEERPAVTPKDKQPVRAAGSARTAPPPVQKPQAKPAEKTEGIVYSVQIGVFRQETNAATLVSQYRDKGYSTWLYKGVTNRGAPLYRVLIGKFEQENDAKKQAETIHARENIPVVLFRK